MEIDHEVVCYDSLITGYRENIEHLIGKDGFRFIEGDIRDVDLLRSSMQGCTHVSHQAALGSVPRSIENPSRTNDINIVGSLNVLIESLNSDVARFVFASSSSVYGDNPNMPKVEKSTGSVLSPYAVTKMALEDYARVFYQIHGIQTIGLRYFNIFGPRQSPEGGYAAVIPLFMESLSKRRSPKIFGDGEQTRDFTYVDNAVEANILALFTENKDSFGRAFNVACGETLSINEVFRTIRGTISDKFPDRLNIEPQYLPPREGDIKDSLADLSEVRECLAYNPIIGFNDGISETVAWFLERRT